jgi:hypothetical protein
MYHWSVTPSQRTSYPLKNGVFWVVTPCGSFTRATRRNNPEDTILHSHRRENLKSYIVIPWVASSTWGPILLWKWSTSSLDTPCIPVLGVAAWGAVLQAGRWRARVPVTRWIFFFSIYVIQPHRDPGLYSTSNGNEYQKIFWGVKLGRRLWLTTSPPSVSRMCRHCEILNISQIRRPPRPVTGIALLFICR